MKLVFVHGSGGSSLSFYYQLRHFRNAKAIDLPGHPRGKPCTSIEGYMEWLRGYIAARRYKDVVLGGHSMGGAIAQLYGLLYPEELRGLILIGTGARLRVHPQYLEECKNAINDNSQWLKNREANLARVAPDVREMLLRRALEIGPAVQLNDLLCCDRFDIMDRVQEIPLPTLVICGTEDVMTPVKYTDYLASKIPNARKTVLEGATHYVLLERPKEVNRAIEEFVRSL
jgi:pimeloyl-ACP methyl ester carboxylesterase